MRAIQAYLIFDGNCREAMQFYKECLGGTLYMMPFSEAPVDTPKEAKERIIHATLTNDAAVLMAADTWPGMPFQQGNNFSVSIGCESLQEIEQLFTAIAENGTVTQLLHV